eukprot:9486770-Pyramimonas_sp.AAC.1
MQREGAARRGGIYTWSREKKDEREEGDRGGVILAMRCRSTGLSWGMAVSIGSRCPEVALRSARRR